MWGILASALEFESEARRYAMKKLAATILFLMLINGAEAQKLEWTNPDGLAGCGKKPTVA
jgi:hypothetical protein